MSNIKLKNQYGKTTMLTSSTSSTSDVSINVGNILHQVDTIDALRGLTTTPSTVYVTGYHVVNDNAFGSNFFKWNPESLEEDNTGTVIKLDGVTTGRYELQYSGSVAREFIRSNK